MNEPYLFIPSYHRPYNLKTVKYFVNRGYDPKKIVVFVDSEADDIEKYEESCSMFGCRLHVFDMQEARARYDYVHRPTTARRSAGQARNMFYEYAAENGITTYVVQDDDTSSMQLRLFGIYKGEAPMDCIKATFRAVEEFTKKFKIGLFGLSQTGDIYSNQFDGKLFRPKVMNTTFVNTHYTYRGERGVQDDDTSQFLGMMNEGLFTGSLYSGVVLSQTESATQAGGLTDLYREAKLVNKSLVCVIQYPSAVHAEYQKQNGGRIHHRVKYKYLFPRIIKAQEGRQGNIAWDRYPEDYPFTNEPKYRRNEERQLDTSGA